MTRYFPVFALAAAIAFLAAPHTAKAQYACPPGYTSIGGGQDAGGFYGCMPLEQDDQPDQAPLWEDRWGAIAIGSGAYGTAGGWATEAEAISTALKECAAHSGSDCAVKMTYYNQCAALAWGDGHYTISHFPKRSAAKADAMKGCSETTRNGKILYTDCSYPEQVR